MSTTEFAHEALLYAGDDGFLAGTMPFVLEGLAADEPLLLVLSAPKVERIKDELNGDRDSDRILFADMDEVGVNPARIIPAWRRFLDEQGAQGHAVRGIGEPIWAEPQPGRAGRVSASTSPCSTSRSPTHPASACSVRTTSMPSTRA